MSKGKRVLIATGIIIALIVIWYLVVVFWHGSTKPILAVADKFQPGASWEMTSETIKPPKIICGDVAVPCPMVTRIWKNKDNPEMTYDQFAALLELAGWSFKVDGRDCKQAFGSQNKPAKLCEATGVKDGFYVDISYTSATEYESAQIYLYVKKNI